MSTGRHNRWVVAGAYVVGVCIRIAQGFCAPFPTESAYGGLMGRRLLEGHWPFFFYGQNWMGGYDALLQAAVYALAGPTALGVVGWAVVLNLATMVMVHRLLVRWSPPQGVWAGLWWMALPPAVGLFWCTYPNLHYPLGLALGAALMLLTARLWERPRRWWEVGLWGLVAGAGIYTNFQFVVVAVPCGVLAGLRRWVWTRAWAAAAGFVVGAAPLLYYEFTHNWVHLSQASAFAPHMALAHLRAFAANALPLVLGLPTPVACGPVVPGGWMYWVGVGLGCAAGVGVVWFVAGARQNGGRVLPVGVGLANVAATVFTVYGVRLSTNALAYLLPLIWLAMPFFWAGLVAAARGRARWVVVGVMGVAVGCSVWGYRYYCRGEFHVLDPAQSWIRAEARRKHLAGALKAAGIGHVYMNCASVLGFYAYPWPVVSDPWQERVLEISCRADASLCPAWVPRAAWNSIGFLGVPTRMLTAATLRLLRAGAPPFKGPQLLPRGWKAQSISGKDLGASLWDLDMATGFSTPSRAAQGDGFVVDLGRVEMVAGLAMVMSDFRDCPAGLKLQLATAPGRWRTIASTTGYWGPMYISGPHPFLKARYPRIECYFPPSPARWIRITHLGRAGRPWRFSELLVYRALEQVHPGQWASTAARVVGVLRRAGTRRVYADAWAAAVVCSSLKHISCTPPNRFSDDYGGDTPPHTRPIPLRIDPATAIVVDERDAPRLMSTLAAAGYSLRLATAGHMRVIFPSPPRPGPWHTPRKIQLRAATLEVTLEGMARPGWVRITAPGGAPRCRAAAVKGPGGPWIPVAIHPAAPLVFTGQVVAACPGPTRTWRLGPTPVATRLRIILASPPRTPLKLQIAPAQN